MKTIIEHFHATVQRYPTAPALITRDTALTYAQLLAQVNTLAVALDAWFIREQQRPITPSDRIGLSLDKGAPLYIAMLAIIATGASYVPIDAGLSEGLQQQLRTRCQCTLVVTQQWILSHVDFTVAAQPGTGRSLATDIAYTLFTSGSTGRPKGVNVTHLNLLNLVAWAVEEFAMGPGVRVLQYSTIHFDASVLDVFPTLLSGSALCVPSEDERMSETALARFCTHLQVTQAVIPPSLLSVFSAERFPTIKTVLSGGETCHPHAIAAWSNGRRFYNLYGPTEATVLVSYKKMNATTPAHNIGRAMTGVRLYILDEHRQPAPRGELHIAGLAVTAGYLNDPVSTREKFVSVPELDASTLYRTGDQVELSPEGDIHFLGRLDRQVKVRGFRIELEEIEAALLQLGYKEAAVMAEPPGHLVAYVVADQGLDSNAVRAALRQHLPDYKVPHQVVQLAAMPYKPNGKVDLGLLLTPPDHGHESPAPENHGETFGALAQLWATELKLPANTLKPESNFRELGGSSINIMHVLSNLETRFGVFVDFIEFFEQPTLQFLINAIDSRRS